MNLALAELRDNGDGLAVAKQERLGRSLRDLLDIADEIRTKDAAKLRQMHAP